MCEPQYDYITIYDDDDARDILRVVAAAWVRPSVISNNTRYTATKQSENALSLFCYTCWHLQENLGKRQPVNAEERRLERPSLTCTTLFSRLQMRELFLESS